MKAQRQTRPRDEIREDIEESLTRRQIRDQSLLSELLLTFAHYLGLAKAEVAQDYERERQDQESED